eukprot:PhM_4_TR8259/c0_g2_i1/m.49323
MNADGAPTSTFHLPECEGCNRYTNMLVEILGHCVFDLASAVGQARISTNLNDNAVLGGGFKGPHLSSIASRRTAAAPAPEELDKTVRRDISSLFKAINALLVARAAPAVHNHMPRSVPRGGMNCGACLISKEALVESIHPSVTSMQVAVGALAQSPSILSHEHEQTLRLCASTLRSLIDKQQQPEATKETEMSYSELAEAWRAS